MTIAGTISVAFRTRVPVILLSILLHLLILIPIGLAVPRLIRPLQPIEYQTIPLDLTPMPVVRSRRLAQTSTPSPGARTVGPSAIQPRIPQTLPAGSTAPTVPAEAPVIEERWRVRPLDPSAPGTPMGRVARIPCPAAPGDRLGQRVCLTGSAMHRPEMPEGHADPLPAGPSRSEQNREEGFERQRRANEAWRDYTRGEGEYPGLRSLFTER
ncbi:hypothetical protein GCM10009422_14980 [Brevundimonas kwangchunensis]|uniref:Energy transducer TonB n=1 Tax=Brevundimonas kwangchunensis TaxID=322163 RepID=A0ABP3RY03_9CAUL